MNIWYRVTDLDTARVFYVERLGFEEVYFDAEDRWIRLVHDGVEIGILRQASIQFEEHESMDHAP